MCQHWATRVLLGLLVGAFAFLLVNIAITPTSTFLRDANLIVPDYRAGVQQVYLHTEVLGRSLSSYQVLEVIKTPFFGKILLLDGDVMFTERDEANYHEMFVHVPLAVSHDAKHVLIIGGGDGGVLSRLVHYQQLESITLVEIDPIVVDFAIRYFPQFRASFSDPRVNLIFDDGAVAVQQFVSQGLHFDIILVDSTDYGIAVPLFTLQFYQALGRLLTPTGVVVANVDSPSWAPDAVAAMYRKFSKVFAVTYPYQVFQPSYNSGHYAFMFGSHHLDPIVNATRRVPPSARYYTPEVHHAAFALPKFLENALK